MTEPIDWKALHPWQRNNLVAEKIMGVTNFCCTGKLSYGGNNSLWKHHYYTCQECHAKLTVTDYYLEGCTVPSEHTRSTPPYSESMDAAWEIVKKRKGAVLDATYKHDMLLCRATFCTVEAVYEAYGVTMPEAVCIAALRAVGVDVRQ